MINLLRWDVVCVLLALASSIALGRKKWWGWLFNALNVIPLTVINIKYNLWAFHFLNASLLVLYLHNAYKWRRTG